MWISLKCCEFFVFLCDFLWFSVIFLYFVVNSCEFLWILCSFVCRYASQVARPNFCMQIRVPNWGTYTRPNLASRITRPKLTSRYASRMSYLLRYSLASQLAVCVVARPKLRVPNCVCRYASQLQSVVYCVRYASQLCVYASQLCV